MKKILSIALVAALLVSSVFAVSFTGDATLSLGYDLDTKDYGFGNGTTTTLKFGFELGSGDGASAGEGDLRAEIAGTFKVEFKETKYTAKGDLKAATISTLKISKANILYKDFLTIGILSAGESADYAKSYYSVNSDGDKVDVLPTFSDVPGFTYKVEQRSSQSAAESVSTETQRLKHTTFSLMQVSMTSQLLMASSSR